VETCKSAGRSLPGSRSVAPGLGRGKSGLHRTRWWVTPTVRKDRESATESIPPWSVVRCQWLGRSAGDNGRRTTDRGKGGKGRGPRPLNVRAHQQPGDRLARQTPPGARPNKRAGLVRPVTTLG